jgi:3-methyladenine DNA glycosylase AlkD
MTLKKILTRLESLGNQSTLKLNRKNGAGDNQYGVKLGDIRKVAEEIKADDELIRQLWETGNIDARLLAILLIKPKKLPRDELVRMVKSVDFPQIADWFNSYVVKQHPDKESLREQWMNASHTWTARAGWSLTSERISKDAEGLDLAALLDRIEAEMGKAAPEVQWTMNSALASIGIHHPRLRKRALAIGEKLGIYRDYPVSKGCTSPFAPLWINEMVRRQH